MKKKNNLSAFSAAHSCSKSTGNRQNCVVDPTEHSMFVDYNLITETDDCMLQAMAACRTSGMVGWW